MIHYKGIKINNKSKIRRIIPNTKKLTPEYFVKNKLFEIDKKLIDKWILYYLYNANNRVIGMASIKINTNNAHIEINKNYQRKGLATFLYNFIEKDLKIKLKPSNTQTKDGKKFWKNRMLRKL